MFEATKRFAAEQRLARPRRDPALQAGEVTATARQACHLSVVRMVPPVRESQGWRIKVSLTVSPFSQQWRVARLPISAQRWRLHRCDYGDACRAVCSAKAVFSRAARMLASVLQAASCEKLGTQNNVSRARLYRGVLFWPKH